MIILSAITFSFMFLIVTLLCIVIFKRFILGKNVMVHYTPFDTITGNTSVHFHEEQSKEVNEDEQGDDKDR